MNNETVEGEKKSSKHASFKRIIQYKPLKNSGKF